ncbi:MAG TPA: hypothetical protein VFM65_05755 [Flavobacteriaceae bacterium]|nr:hypothetical protein [Flavobacteriaceae bacterium]
MYNFKIPFSLFLLLPLVFQTNAQDAEWHNLTGLLQQEAEYFTQKNGFIQLTESSYNTFVIEKFSINDTMMVSAMRLNDRFENEHSEHYLKETIVFQDYGYYNILSAGIMYDCDYYFEDFPEAQFLLIEFEKEMPLIHQIVSIYKDLKSGQEDKTTMEEATNQLLFPIRSKNRRKIFKAIDRYQSKTLKTKLEINRH